MNQASQQTIRADEGWRDAAPLCARLPRGGFVQCLPLLFMGQQRDRLLLFPGEGTLAEEDLESLPPALLQVAVAQSLADERMLSRAGFLRIAPLCEILGLGPKSEKGADPVTPGLEGDALILARHSCPAGSIAAWRDEGWLHWRYGLCPRPAGARAIAGQEGLRALAIVRPLPAGGLCVEEWWTRQEDEEGARILLAALSLEAREAGGVLSFLLPLHSRAAQGLLGAGLELHPTGATLFARTEDTRLHQEFLRQRWWWSRGELLLSW